ncbi:MAG: RsmE family RNA methyltransferase [Candidatus Limnocylindria bacterium]
MTLHRFFVEPAAMAGDAFVLPSTIERQVRSVLRLGDGDRIVLLPGDGSEVLCRLDGDDCVVEQRAANAAEPRHRLTVVQALLKGDALEQVIQHATEIGVAGFRLVITERCVVRDLSPRKLERLRTIAREAAEQSERGVVPAIDAPVRLADALSPGSVLLHERSDRPGLARLDPPAAVIIGPEGGWSPAETADVERAGIGVASLGARILRSETVAVAAAAVVLSRSGDFA